MRHPRVFPRHPNLFALFLLTLLLQWNGAGCGEENVALIYTIYVTANPTDITHEGSASSTISVRVLDQNNRPAESGLRLLLSARDSSGGETGRFTNSAEARESTFLDTAGAAQSSFSCTDEGDVTIIAQLETGDLGATLVKCEVMFDGNSTITRLWADRQRIRPNEQVDVFAEARDSNGDPVGQGAGIIFTIEDGNGGLGALGGPQARGNVTPDGIATTQFQAGPQQGATTIVARFEIPSEGTVPSDPLVISVDINAPVEPDILAGALNPAMLADGETTTVITATVFEAGGTVVPDAPIDVTTDEGSVRKGDGQSWGAALTVDTNATGQAEFQFKAGTNPGRANVSLCVDGRIFDPAVDEDVCTELTIRLLSVGSINSRGTEEVPLGVRESGRNESTELCFEVRDTLEEPFPQGTTVNFNVSTTSAGGYVSPLSVQTDAEGQVCTTVTSGSTFGIISIEPCVEVGAADVCGTPIDIPVTGATPTRAGMTLSCDHVNLGALRYLVGNTITTPESGELCTRCALTLRDRFGNPVGFPYTVTFAAEIGTFAPSASATNNTSGQVSVKWCAGDNLPLDVEALDDEPYWTDGPVEYNPRDGLVSILAYVVGEEEFVDGNENGRWNEGEVFWDLSEPFIDADDNNQFDADLEQERHIDVDHDGNNAGVFDLPNLEWDSDAFIWVQTRVLLTGSPAFGDFDEGNALIELDLDPDYNSLGGPFRLSHWYVQKSATEFNVYESDVPNPRCDQFPSPEYCLSLGDVIPAGGQFDLFFVARDIFGNPMNASLANLSFEVFPAACSSLMTITDANELTPNGDDYPFTFEINRTGIARTRTLIEAGDAEDLEQLYPVKISDFVAGSSELFLISYDGAPLGQECRFRVTHPMKACPTCNDPTDEPPWPFMIITE